MIGYTVYGHDNDTYFFYDREDVQRCKNCSHLINKWTERLTGIPITKKSLEISYSYDGVLVVNGRFAEVIAKEGLQGLNFVPIEGGYFHIRPVNEVRFDVVKRETRFLNQCHTCGNYESVVGASPAFLIDESIPEEGFVRTDVEFGSNDSKSPIVICGTHAGKILKARKFKGLDMEEIS